MSLGHLLIDVVFTTLLQRHDMVEQHRNIKCIPLGKYNTVLEIQIEISP